jgi:organic hydroperoxide reductase OsmC/OhrA
VVTWTGNRGTGTSGYREYDRDCDLAAPGRPVIAASSDPLFRGDAGRWNPEQLLIASLSQCHLLWYLHLAAEAGVVVTAYVDEAVGSLDEQPGGAGEFTEVVLRPRVTVASPEMVRTALALHPRAHELCFIARSVNFPVGHEPTVVAATA